MEKDQEKSVVAEAVVNFNNLIDVTANFLKTIFPHGEAIVNAIRERREELKNRSQK